MSFSVSLLPLVPKISLRAAKKQLAACGEQSGTTTLVDAH
jgi:hypothetical protein